MASIVWDSHTANIHQFLDPNDDPLEGVSQNNGALITAPLNDPLFFYALLLPVIHGRKYCIQLRSALKATVRSSVFFTLLQSCKGPEVPDCSSVLVRMRRCRSEGKVESKTYSLILKMCEVQ